MSHNGMTPATLESYKQWLAEEGQAETAPKTPFGPELKVVERNGSASSRATVVLEVSHDTAKDLEVLLQKINKAVEA